MNKLLLSAIALVLLLSACTMKTQTVWLDEMDLTRMETGWGEIKINKSVEGNPLTIAGTKYGRGIGVHSLYKYLLALDGNGRKFTAKVGVDDESGKAATVEFFVLGDKQVLWQSGVMKPGDPAKDINLKIKGIKKLALYISDGGDNINYDHADWIDAKFEYVKTTPVSVESPKTETYILTPPVSDKPRINGAVVVGANPGHPFVYRVPVTGHKPVMITVEDLPSGLSYNADSRVISGMAPLKGEYQVKISARNDAGEDSKIILIKTDSGLALTPPLGWNSWNCWGLSVDQEKVKASADAMINSGLADHGWSNINIDDGWEAAERTINGELLANEKFPDMKSVADYCHKYGLKLGIYSSPGPRTCGGYQGSYQHELQDVKTWAKWGIDYVKYDWCSYGEIAPKPTLDEMKKPYILMRECLDKADRDIVFSLCQYGMGKVWEWGDNVGGELWRTTGDITDSWNSMAGIGFDQAASSPYAGPGHWNDPDMLVVGQVGWGPSLHASRLTPDEQYTHISLWSLLASPLLIGCDMTQLDSFTLNLLTNDEVLAVNQDPEGEAALPVKQEPGIEIWSRTLADGSKAVGIFFTGAQSPVESFTWDNETKGKQITVNWSDLGFTGKAVVRDLWRQQDLGTFEGSFTATVNYHGVLLIRIAKE
ncbi:MAG TPA: alpha-galactosidase [Bacteroidales bacterium]|nr:alpha-galactosidase [Bacteroidales bacterium]